MTPRLAEPIEATGTECAPSHPRHQRQPPGCGEQRCWVKSLLVDPPVASRGLVSATVDDDAPSFLANHYFNVPNEWLPHLGKLAVLSARIENSAYNVAGLLGVPRPQNGRTPGFGKECQSIRARLADPWFPQFIDTGLPGWRDATTDWTKRASRVLDSTRNLYLHSNYVHGWVDEALVPMMEDRINRGASREVTLQDVAAAVEELAPIEQEGLHRWIQLVEFMQDHIQGKGAGGG